MSDKERHIAFIDILGLRHALSTGKIDVAESKILRLASIVESTVNKFPFISAHGATDFFVLWSTQPAAGADIAYATV